MGRHSALKGDRVVQTSVETKESSKRWYTRLGRAAVGAFVSEQHNTSDTPKMTSEKSHRPQHRREASPTGRRLTAVTLCGVAVAALGVGLSIEAHNKSVRPRVAIDTPDVPLVPEVETPSTPSRPVFRFPDAAYTISDGEGVEQTLDEMGITDTCVRYGIAHDKEFQRVLVAEGAGYVVGGEPYLNAGRGFSDTSLRAVKEAEDRAAAACPPADHVG